MRRRAGTVFILLVIIFAVFCRDCAAFFPEEAFDGFPTPPAGPLESRVFTPNGFIVSMSEIYNKTFESTEQRNVPYYPSKEELDEIAYVISRMPETYRDMISPHLLGIFFVENIPVGGTVFEMPKSEDETYYIIILNAEMLRTSASDWLTQKEKRCFYEDGSGYDLNIDLGNLSAFSYVLFHELGHLFEWINYPRTNEPPPLDGNNPEYMMSPFREGVWLDPDHVVKQYDFDGRDSLAFYQKEGTRFPMADLPARYQHLSHTPFVTMYSTTNPGDDFAEFMATYMCITYMDQPWTLTVTRDGEIVFRITDILQRPELQRRIDFIKQIIE